jgi:hypothetical protein
MAIMLLPLAFAGAGYLGFGGIGAAAGWLIGSWLFGPKSTTDNQIFDPGAQEMPRFNQSLRGVTIPILFGTNRVASNIVWVKNWQTIRKETQAASAGGKSGGSGGGGKGQQSGGTQVSYEYKWDMIFQLGMVTEPFGIYGGWSNTQRINGDTMLAIIQGTQGLPPITLKQLGSFATAGASGLSSINQQSTNMATLTFDDAFFGSGGPTNDDGFSNWDYFEAQEGVPARWPNTVYVGFKALSLGSSAAVPQLSFEVGPGTGSIQRTPKYLSNSHYQDSIVNTNAIMLGLDKKHYVILNQDDINLYLMRLEDGTVISYAGNLLPEFSGFTGSGRGGKGWAAGGSEYVMFTGWSNYSVSAQLLKINAAGAIEVVESTTYMTFTDVSMDIRGMTPIGFGFMSFDGIMKKDTGFLTWICAYARPGGSHPDDYQVVLLSWEFVGATPAAGLYPYPDFDHTHTAFGSGPKIMFQPLTSGDYNPPFSMGTQVLDQIGFVPQGMRTSSQLRAFMLPLVGSGSPATGGAWPVRYYICFYVSKAMIAADTGGSSVITTYKAAYPNGFVIGYLATGHHHALGYDVHFNEPEIMNGRFIDDADQPVLMTDGGLALDGVTADQHSDYLNPTITVTQQGGVIVIFPKVFDLQPDQGAMGSYVKLMVYAWNPLAGKAALYTKSEGPFYDMVADLGATPGGRNTPFAVECFFDEIEGNLYVVASYVSTEYVGNRTVAAIWGPMEIGGGLDVLVAYIIYKILTDPVSGMGIAESIVDQDSYKLALQYCDAQGYRVSVQYTREESVLSAIEDLLALSGMYLIDSGGTVRFGIQQATSVPVRVIDNHHLVPPKEGEPPVKVTKGALVDGFNKIRMNYFDRSLDYRQNQLEIGDEVDQDINGVRFKEFPAKYVMNIQMAQTVIERALWTNLYARDTFAFALGWKDADLEPGDVITLVDSFHPELSVGKQVRIAHWQEKKRGVFDVQAVLEVPYYMTANHSVTPSNSAGIAKGSGPVVACSDFRMYELPREFQSSKANLYAGYNQLSNIRGATLWISADNISFAPAVNAEPYLISGQFARALPACSPGNMDRDVEMYIMPASGFSVATPTFCQTLALDDVTAPARASGAGILICGSEALSMENLTLLGQNHYRIGRLYRGWGGTMPQAHSSGALWHKHGSGILAMEISTDKIGTTLYYKVVPYSFGGSAVDVSSITSKPYNIRGAYWLPQEMSGLHTYVNSPLSGSQSADLRGSVYRAVASGGCDVTFAWADCARQEGFGTGGFGKSTFGHYLADLDSHAWRVEVMSGGVAVRSVSVTSGPFTYTRAQNSADFAGFGNAFQVRVTPYNNYGDAPIAAVKSLNLFW